MADDERNKDIDERDNRQWSMKYSELREELTEMYHILNDERRRFASNVMMLSGRL